MENLDTSELDRRGFAQQLLSLFVLPSIPTLGIQEKSEEEAWRDLLIDSLIFDFISFSKDGNLKLALKSGMSFPRYLIIEDLSSQKSSREIVELNGYIRKALPLSNCKALIVSASSYLRTYDLEGKLIDQVIVPTPAGTKDQKYSGAITGLSINRDSTKVAVAVSYSLSRQQHVLVVDLNKGKIVPESIKRFKFPDALRIRHLEFCPKTDQLVVVQSRRDGKPDCIYVFEAQGQDLKKKFRIETPKLLKQERVVDLAISPKGGQFVTLSARGLVTSYSIETGKRLWRKMLNTKNAGNDTAASNLDFNSDGDLLLVAWLKRTIEPTGYNSHVDLRNPENGSKIKRFSSELVDFVKHRAVFMPGDQMIVVTADKEEKYIDY